MRCLLMGGFLFSIFGQIASTTLFGIELTIDPIGRQAIRGWGFTPGPLDWDGRNMLRDRDLMDQIYRQSGVSIVRLVLGTGGIFWEEKGGINADRTKAILFPQILALTESGVREYIISMVVPPSVMRKYRSDESYVELDPNELRSEREDAYVAFLTSLIDLIAKEKLPLPRAMSFQAQPDRPSEGYFGSTSFPGCPYSPEQWKRVGAKLRAALDGAGFSVVGILGPETYGHSWFSRAFKGSRTDETTTLAFLSGVAFNSTGTGDEKAKKDEVFQAVLNDTHKAGREIWITNYNLEKASDDTAVLLETFAGMRTDLVEYRADYWFWRYAFTWDIGAESLVQGRNHIETPTYRALRVLWNAVPPGAEVHAVHPTRFDFPAFALVTKSRTFAVLVNRGPKPEIVAFRGILASGAAQYTFTNDRTPDVQALKSTTGVWSARVPTRSVSFLVFAHLASPNK